MPLDLHLIDDALDIRVVIGGDGCFVKAERLVFAAYNENECRSLEKPSSVVFLMKTRS